MFGLMTVARHRELLAARDSKIETLEHSLSDWQRTYHELCTKYFDATAPKPPEPTIREKPDPVTSAITEVAGTNLRLRGLMSRQAMEMRKANVSDDDIIKAIFDGVSDDDGVPYA